MPSDRELARRKRSLFMAKLHINGAKQYLKAFNEAVVHAAEYLEAVSSEQDESFQPATNVASNAESSKSEPLNPAICF